MKIYFDLDGPILDPKQRYWLAHSQAVSDLGGKPYKNANFYWKQKQNFTSKSAILKQCKLSLDLESEYIEKYAFFVESDELLKHDKLQPQVKTVLRKLSLKHELLLVTARANSLNVKKQLKDLGLDQFFQQVLITNTRPGQNQDGDKTELIRNEAQESNNLGCLIIGDTSAEMNAAKQLNIRSVAVLNGLRTSDYLKQFNPDFIISGIKDLPQIVNQLDPV